MIIYEWKGWNLNEWTNGKFAVVTISPVLVSPRTLLSCFYSLGHSDILFVTASMNSSVNDQLRTLHFDVLAPSDSSSMLRLVLNDLAIDVVGACSIVKESARYIFATTSKRLVSSKRKWATGWFVFIVTCIIVRYRCTSSLYFFFIAGLVQYCPLDYLQLLPFFISLSVALIVLQTCLREAALLFMCKVSV